MNQDVTIFKALESIDKQLGGLTPKQQNVIEDHLYLVYGVGVDNALKLVQSKSKRIICITPLGKEYPYQSIREASRSLKLRRDDIRDVLEGKKNSYKNYKFRYD